MSNCNKFPPLSLYLINIVDAFKKIHASLTAFDISCLIKQRLLKHAYTPLLPQSEETLDATSSLFSGLSKCLENTGWNMVGSQ